MTVPDYTPIYFPLPYERHELPAVGHYDAPPVAIVPPATQGYDVFAWIMQAEVVNTATAQQVYDAAAVVSLSAPLNAANMLR